jgi:hypothetical protein
LTNFMSSAVRSGAVMIPPESFLISNGFQSRAEPETLLPFCLDRPQHRVRQNAR